MYEIIQTLDSWCVKEPEIKLIRKFRFYLSAWFYKFFYYDFADPAWQGSFDWKIQKD